MGRLTPHYVQNMYHKEKDGFTAVLFGGSRFTYELDGVPVTVRQVTDYPAHLTVQFEVTAKHPVTFAFGIRKTRWATSMQVQEAGHEEANRYVIEKEWSGTQCFTVTFTCDVKMHTDFCKNLFVSYGPLLYALPIESEDIPFLHMRSPRSGRWGMNPPSPSGKPGRLTKTTALPSGIRIPPMEIGSTRVSRAIFGMEKTIESTLVPMGGTILRKVTFPMEIGGKNA